MLTTRPTTRFDQALLPRLLVPILAAMLLAAAGQSGARADDKPVSGNTFVIADNDGYGIMDCVVEGKSCARVVADAWCEAHGFSAAKSFGPASDITGAIPVSTAAKAPAGAALIACAD